MTDITVSEEFHQKIVQGARLVTDQDVIDSRRLSQIEDGSRVQLVDPQGNFVGQMLVGRQNKGLGWIYSLSPLDKWNEAYIQKEIITALADRFSSFELDITNAFRLFNGEGDGLGGVTIDYYNGYILINWYSRGIFAYRHWIIDALVESNEQFKGIYEVKRFSLRNDEEAIEQTWGEPVMNSLLIKENQVNYATYLGEEWMTGIFLDQREVRDFIKTQAQDLSVLNLFSYTGAFSVAAAKGGASKTVSVDIANRSLDRTREQFLVNDIPLGKEHEIRVMDVFDYIQYAKRQALLFDIVVCDPPSFARNKQRTFSVEKDYYELARDLFSLTQIGGFTIISTNHAGLPKQSFLDTLMKASQSFDGTVQLIQSYDLPADFPTTADAVSKYLKVFIFYRTQ